MIIVVAGCVIVVMGRKLWWCHGYVGLNDERRDVANKYGGRSLTLWWVVMTEGGKMMLFLCLVLIGFLLCFL